MDLKALYIIRWDRALREEIYLKMSYWRVLPLSPNRATLTSPVTILPDMVMETPYLQPARGMEESGLFMHKILDPHLRCLSQSLTSMEASKCKRFYVLILQLKVGPDGKYVLSNVSLQICPSLRTETKLSFPGRESWGATHGQNCWNRPCSGRICGAPGSPCQRIYRRSGPSAGTPRLGRESTCSNEKRHSAVRREFVFLRSLRPGEQSCHSVSFICKQKETGRDDLKITFPRLVHITLELLGEL